MLCYEQLQSGRVVEETKSREVCVLGMRGFACLLLKGVGVVELVYIQAGRQAGT